MLIDNIAGGLLKKLSWFLMSIIRQIKIKLWKFEHALFF